VRSPSKIRRLRCICNWCPDRRPHQTRHATGCGTGSKRERWCRTHAVTRLNESIGTILLIILVIALLGGFSGLGGDPFYGTGYYGGGGLGLVLIVVLLLVVTGSLSVAGTVNHLANLLVH
jgi:hypothetical protein